MEPSINVYGEALQPCGEDPVTGFYRDGCCNTSPADGGSHTVCARVSGEFLAFSRQRGNDLVAPRPAFGFPGLKDGDCWCLCARRWLEAHQAGAAPRVYLRRTHQRALDVVPLEDLLPYALDVS